MLKRGYKLTKDYKNNSHNIVSIYLDLDLDLIWLSYSDLSFVLTYSNCDETLLRITGFIIR